MKLQYISDLHENLVNINPIAEYIALIGDVASPFDPNYEKYLQYLSQKFQGVFVVMGNHEYYGSIFNKAEEQMELICNKFSNVFLLNNKSFLLNGVLIVGSTLWSNINQDSFNFLNCRELIKMNGRRKMTIQDYIQKHKEAVEFIENEVKKGYPTIILTHYAPLNEMNGNKIHSPYSSGFSSDLSYINNSNIKAWLSGHTHNCISICRNKIFYSSNCLGEQKNNTRFNPERFILV